MPVNFSQDEHLARSSNQTFKLEMKPMLFKHGGCGWQGSGGRKTWNALGDRAVLVLPSGTANVQGSKCWKARGVPSNSWFMKHAKTLTLSFELQPCVFNTGNLGWRSCRQDVTVTVEGVQLVAMIHINAVIPGSNQRHADPECDSHFISSPARPGLPTSPRPIENEPRMRTPRGPGGIRGRLHAMSVRRPAPPPLADASARSPPAGVASQRALVDVSSGQRGILSILPFWGERNAVPRPENTQPPVLRAGEVNQHAIGAQSPECLRLTDGADQRSGVLGTLSKGLRRLLGGTVPALEDNPVAPSAKRRKRNASMIESQLAPALLALLSADNERILQIQDVTPVVEAGAGEKGARKKELQDLARKEIDRILAVQDARDVFGRGSRDHQKREYNRIVRLLHPDKGFVDRDDERAEVALRVVQAARKCMGQL